jgi:hypothetical protein
MNQLDERALHLHVSILGWLCILGNALLLLGGAFVFILLAGIGAASGDSQALGILGIIGTAVGMLLAALALPGLAAGYGLLRRRAWARVLALVLSILALAGFPLGTLVGAYAIWVLLQNTASAYFA